MGQEVKEHIIVEFVSGRVLDFFKSLVTEVMTLNFYQNIIFCHYGFIKDRFVQTNLNKFVNSAIQSGICRFNFSKFVFSRIVL